MFGKFLRLRMVPALGASRSQPPNPRSRQGWSWDSGEEAGPWHTSGVRCGQPGLGESLDQVPMNASQSAGNRA